MEGRFHLSLLSFALRFIPPSVWFGAMSCLSGHTQIRLLEAVMVNLANWSEVRVQGLEAAVYEVGACHDFLCSARLNGLMDIFYLL